MNDDDSHSDERLEMLEIEMTYIEAVTTASIDRHNAHLALLQERIAHCAARMDVEFRNALLSRFSESDAE